MTTYSSDRERAAGQGPLRRIPSLDHTTSLSCSTVAVRSTSALDSYIGETVFFAAKGGAVAVAIGATATGVSAVDCAVVIADGEFEEFFISEEDADGGLVYVASAAGAPTLLISKAKPYTTSG